MIESNKNMIYISVASVWEMAIKISINKLKLNCKLIDFIPDGINILSIEFNHIIGLDTLPFYHSDPFDRLIISQAINERMKVMTVDEYFKDYDVQLI